MNWGLEGSAPYSFSFCRRKRSAAALLGGRGPSPAFFFFRDVWTGEHLLDGGPLSFAVVFMLDRKTAVSPSSHGFLADDQL